MSAKTSTQPGRRTPLSLTGSATKGQSNKGGGSNAASNSGNNANGHSTANSNKDNKLQQQKTEQQKTNNADTKENPNNNKKVHQQSEKKQQQQNDNNKKSIEKNQNGINNNSKQHQQQANENKQSQQQPKDSKQQNGNENKLNENKLNENDKKEKPEKEQDKTEKVETKAKEDKKSELEKQENNKKEDKKTKEVKDSKDTTKTDTNETANRVVVDSAQDELHEKSDDKNLKVEKDGQVANPKSEDEKNDSMEVVEEQQQSQQKSPPSTPKPNKANKSSTALNKTSTEKTPQKITYPNVTIKTAHITKREVTTTIDDVDMEPLTVEGSPVKTTQQGEVANLNIAPSATSTPGKILLSKRHSAAPKSEVQLAMQSSAYSPERPRGFSQISGRKSIRPITDYTPSKFHSNLQFRESYRRINTELDVTNTSINVTVGSEVASNLSFSFFGRGRKRERTPPQLSQSAIGELHTDVEVSPPKKARLEGFFSAVSSPLTLLRNRFSKATLQSSTPVNLQQKLNAAEDEIEVQNVSGLSIHEDLSKTEIETEMSVASNNEVDGDTGEAKSNSAIKEVLEGKDCNDVSLKTEISCGVEQSYEASDIKITETLLKPAVGDPLNKNKRCIVM